MPIFSSVIFFFNSSIFLALVRTLSNFKRRTTELIIMDRINNVKAEALIQGAIKIVRNAQCLCDESELLHNNKMFARSYALSHLAREEFAKSLMLYKVCIDVLSGNKVDWKKVDRRFRDHKQKLVNDQFTTDMLFDSIELDGKKIDKKVLFNSGTIEYTNHRKNASLYVDWENGEFTSPEENFTERQSHRNLEIAKFRILTLSGVVLSLVEISKKSKEEIKEIFPMEKIMEMAKEYTGLPLIQ